MELEIVSAAHFASRLAADNGSWYNALSRHPHPLSPSRRAADAFVDACEADPDSNDLRERQWEELKAIVEWTRANCK